MCIEVLPLSSSIKTERSFFVTQRKGDEMPGGFGDDCEEWSSECSSCDEDAPAITKEPSLNEMRQRLAQVAERQSRTSAAAAPLATCGPSAVVGANEGDAWERLRARMASHSTAADDAEEERRRTLQEHVSHIVKSVQVRRSDKASREAAFMNSLNTARLRGPFRTGQAAMLVPPSSRIRTVHFFRSVAVGSTVRCAHEEAAEACHSPRSGTKIPSAR